MGAEPALRIGEHCWSYAELAGLAVARTRSLRGLGLAARQVVVCDAVPGLDLIVLQHALARSGAALLPVRPGTSQFNAIGIDQSGWR